MKRFSFASLLVGLVALLLPVSSSAAVSGSGPTFTTSSRTSFVEGSRGTFNISVSDRLKTLFRWSGKLPTGLTFFENGDGTTATLAGTPAVGSAGSYTVTVRAVDTSGAHAAQSLKVTVRPISSSNPVVQTVSPSTNSDKVVTITGINFKGATAVHFGSTAASFTVDTAGTSINATVPTGAAGSVDITVTSPGGSSPVSLDDQFTFNLAPQQSVIVNVQPESLGILAKWAPNATSDKVTRYTVTATVAADYKGGAAAAVPTACAAPPAVSALGTATSAVISTGVCTGVPYVVSLTATNRWGTSTPSASSNVVVPLVAQPPSAPLITSVFARSGALIVNWAAPANSGGVVLRSYELTATPTTGKTQLVSATVPSKDTHFTINGLKNKDHYALSLTAKTAAGDSPPATALGTPSAISKPGDPASLQVVPNSQGNLVLTWSAPNDTGSAHLSGYVLSYNSVNVAGVAATSKASRATVTVPSSTTSHTLSHLVLTDYYSVSISAMSSVGTGPPRSTTGPVTPTVQAAPGTHVLSGARMKSLLSETVDSAGDGNILTWPASTTFDPKLSPGMVIVGPPSAAAPHGLLVVVQTVSTSHSGKYLEVDTTPANFSDAFRTLSFSSSSDPTFTLPFSYSNDGLTASGQVVLIPSVWLSFSFQCTATYNAYVLGVYVGSVCYRWSASGEAGASLGASAQLVANLTGSVTVPVDSFPIGMQFFVVGYIPVYLDESIDINVILTSTGMSLTASATGNLFGKIDWSSSSGFSHSSGASLATSIATSAASTNSTSSADLQVELNICAYGDILCGDVAVDGILTGTVNIAATPYLALCPSIKIGAGFAIDIDLWVVSWSTSNNITIATIPSSSLGGCYDVTNPPAVLFISPSTPTVPIGTAVRSFTATRSDGKQPTNSWSLLNGIAGDSISSAGELSTGSPGSRVLYVKDADSTLPVDFPATRTVTVGTTIAYDPPGNPAVAFIGFPIPVHHTYVIGVDFSWNAPVNTGGALITSYIVTIDGLTYTTTGTNIDLPASLFQSTYHVQVSAVNANGVASPSADLENWVTGQIG